MRICSVPPIPARRNVLQRRKAFRRRKGGGGILEMRLSPGSENCTEIGLRWACNGPVHSNGPSLALRMALTCAPGGTPPPAKILYTSTLLHICTPPAPPRAIFFHCSQNGHWREKWALMRIREKITHRLHLAHETHLALTTLLYIANKWITITLKLFFFWNKFCSHLAHETHLALTNLFLALHWNEKESELNANISNPMSIRNWPLAEQV